MPANVLSVVVSGLGMMTVALLAFLLWWRVSRVQVRWFWFGDGLWTIAVALKIVCALLANQVVLNSLNWLPHPLYVALGGLYLGVQSSVFEMGFGLTQIGILGVETAMELFGTEKAIFGMAMVLLAMSSIFLLKMRKLRGLG